MYNKSAYQYIIQMYWYAVLNYCVIILEQTMGRICKFAYDTFVL